MDKKFQPLDYSRGWDDYWRDHPQGYSPQEQMINWAGQLNAMIDFFNEYFGVDLTEYATDVMEGWYFDGRLDEIINEALFDSKADKTTVNNLIDSVYSKADKTTVNSLVDSVDAHGSWLTYLNNRLLQDYNQFTAQLAQKANESDLTITDNRINDLIANAGDGTVPSELTDIRVGADGKTYATAGQSVREQLLSLDNKVKTDIENVFLNADFKDPATAWKKFGGSLTVSGGVGTFTISATNNSLYQDNIPTSIGDKILVYFMAKSTFANRTFTAFVNGTYDNGALINSEVDQWKTVMAIVEADNVTAEISIKYLDAQIGESYQVTKPIAINLTKSFGLGNEPDKNTMNDILQSSFSTTEGIENNSLVRFLFNNIKTKNKLNNFIVNQNGSGDYTTINEALAMIKDTKANPVTLIIMPGTYVEKIKLIGRFVTLVGVDKQTCIIKSFDNDYLNPPIDLSVNSNVVNLTVIADANEGTIPGGLNGLAAYAIHFDIATREGGLTQEQLQGISVISNCNLISKNNDAIGIGTLSNQHLKIDNINALSYTNMGMRMHNQLSDNGVNEKISVANSIIVTKTDGAALGLRDVNRKDGIDVEYTFNNVVAYSEINGFTGALDISHAGLQPGAVVGQVMLGKGSFGNSHTRLNQTIGE